MGVMGPQPPLVLTPHPVTLEGQKFIPVQVHEGETLRMFLDRSVDLGADAWEVRIGGVVVPVEMWDRVRPKHGHLIEVRGAVNKQALYIVAFALLTWWTGGAFAAAGSGGTVFGLSGAAAYAATMAVYVAGSILINKVLGPKPPKQEKQDRESVYNLAAGRNALRPHEPLGLLLGSTRFAPDVLSMPYSFYKGNDQYVAMVLTPGLNVDRFDELYLGDTPLSDFEGVRVFTAGFPGMTEQLIPIYHNVDTVAGGELSSSTWVTRTTSADTNGVMINIEYLLGGVGTSGKKYYVDERVDVEYRPVGGGAWMPLINRPYRSNELEQKRDTLFMGFPSKGQYDIRVRIAGLGNYEGENTHQNTFQWSTLASIQEDKLNYRGIPRIGIEMKATGQLNGTPDQIRAVFHQKPMPFWTGDEWATATDRMSGLSNPGALILQYARGYYDPDGNLVAGMGLSDAQIDVQAFMDFTLHCEANGYTYDYWLQTPRSHREVHESIARAGFGQTTWAGGRFSVVWAAAEQPTSGAVNMGTIKRGQFEVDYALANMADGIEFTYFDRTTWETATVRVPAPGVETMLNPARVTGEGVSDEAHAAEMARWHLAQHLYQFKSIGYSTDLEHLSYKRLSKLALQHDLTKWGKGGRLVDFTVSDGVVTVTLDEVVPAPAAGKAYIGIRIPSERVMRIFEVASFADETDTITLVDPWPTGVPMPGNTDKNPAHDSIWIYDFKATPGYTVRVTSIEPDAGQKGAKISVVPESPEFWNYVKTGYYEPPVPNPMLPQRPVASNIRVSEVPVTQGDTVFTELSLLFDINGAMDYAAIYVSQQVDGVWGPVEHMGDTRSMTFRFRIPGPGTYNISVRPYDREGVVGGVASVIYTTTQTGILPPPFDWFDVIDQPSGLRRYVWSYNATTMRASDFVGAEIRHSEGANPSPDWDTMTPLGDDGGFYTAAFESPEPLAGVWTFAIRARNTSGDLSASRIIIRTLTESIHEVIPGIADDFSELDERFDDLSEYVDTTVDDLQEAIDNAAGGLQDQIDDILAGLDVADVPDWKTGTTYTKGTVVRWNNGLYLALLNVPAGVAPSNTTYWRKIGDFTSTGEAIAWVIDRTDTISDDGEATAQELSLLGAKNGAGSAFILNQNTARVTPTETLGQRLDSIQASFGDANARIDAEVIARADGDGALAQDLSLLGAKNGAGNAFVLNQDTTRVTPTETLAARLTGIQTAFGDANARIDAEVTARTNADTALGTRTNAIEVRMPTGSGSLATEARVVQAEQAAATGDAANALLINQVSARIGESTDNIVKKSTFNDALTTGWSASASTAATTYATENRMISFNTGIYEENNWIPVEAGDEFDVSAVVYTATTGAGIGFGLHVQNKNGGNVSWPVATKPTAGGFQVIKERIGPLPAGSSRVRPFLNVPGGGTGQATKLRIERVTQAAQQTATAMMALSADVSAATGKVNTMFSVNLDANGYHSGVLAQNNGTVSSWKFRADTFEIVSTTGTGLSWTAGTLWNRRGSYSFMTGPTLGENMLLYIGPTPSSPAAAQKAQALFYVDTAGVGYFAGQVLQGIIRTFNSSTAVWTSGNLTVTADMVSSNNKPVAVLANFMRSHRITYLGTSSVITLTGGQTRARIRISRQYEGEGYVTIYDDYVLGQDHLLNDPAGPSTLTHTFDARGLTTDVASTKRRRYQIVISDISLRSHTVTNPGTGAAPVFSQYQSIESME